MQVRPHLKSARDWIRQILFGMCMGASDLVPGISGGTMALILGIYEDFIYSVRSFGSTDAFSIFSLQFRRFNKAVSWDFLLGLLIGVSLTFALLSQVIQQGLNDPDSRRYLYAGFIGMILAAATICYRKIRIWKYSYAVVFIFGAVLTYFSTGTRTDSLFDGERFNVPIPKEKLNHIAEKEIRNYDQRQQTLLDVPEPTLAAMLARQMIDPRTQVYNIRSGTSGNAASFVSPHDLIKIKPWLIACGAMAISAMMLPGISGCYLLTILGVYPIVIGALADFFRSGDFDSFVILCNMGVGIVFGAILFSQVVAYLLRHYHDATLAMLLGFMIGALHTIWPFFHYDYLLEPLKLDKGPMLNILGSYVPSFADPQLFIAACITLGGFFLVFALETLSKKIRT